jgi:murein DD-endopeptidase MepM/ murein hydrolase activator NlpD
LLLVLSGPAVAGSVSLDGPLTQGGLVVGRTEPSTVVTFEGKKVRVSPEGVFVIGFSRDAPPTAKLDLRHSDGSMVTKILQVKKRKYRIQRIDGLPPKMVTPPKKVLARIRRENAMIGRARNRDTPVPHFMKGWIWPAKGRVSGVYGSQRILNGKPRRPHFGVDVAAPVGTPIVAPSDGVVRLVEPDLYYTGGTVIIDHGHGVSSAFLHMRDVTAKLGKKVRQGEQIGTLGATGRATGPHLDWRINYFRARIDPALLVPPMPKPVKARKKRKS